MRTQGRVERSGVLFILMRFLDLVPQGVSSKIELGGLPYGW